jgi:hypothetical protein
MIPKPDRRMGTLTTAAERSWLAAFTAVCAHGCSPREAAIKTGVIKASPARYGGACNFAAAAALSAKKAQCTLIARVLEPRLGSAWLSVGARGED